MTFFVLKQLTAAQLPAITELDQLCFGKLWTLEGYRRELLSSNSDLLGLGTEAMARQGEQGGNSDAPCPNFYPPLIGIGCLWAILEEAHITLLGIHPEYRGDGLGTAMLHALLWVAWKRGLERATLEVRASNFTALSIYRKFGFQEAGRRQRYYQDNGEDALILWRSGLQKPEFRQTLADWQQQISDRLISASCHLSVEWDHLTDPNTPLNSG